MKNYYLNIILILISLTLIYNEVITVQENQISENLRLLTTTTGEPAGALGQAPFSNYVAKGKESQLGDLPIYTVGTATKNAVIFVHDGYGWNGSRNREVADRIACNGYYVILPDFYRGNYTGKKNADGSNAMDLNNYTFDMANKDLTTLVYPYLETLGFTKWSLVGACWGSYINWKASTNAKVIAAASFHPALSLTKLLLQIK